MEDTLLRPFWRRLFPAPWVLGMLLVLLWGVPRFVLVLGANMTGSYQQVSLIFASMWLTPFIFLSAAGRQRMGWRRPQNPRWLLYGLFIGLGFFLLMLMAAIILFGTGPENWFTYIGRSYRLPAEMSDADRLVFFLIYASVSMTFSPVGEELFYRGVIHECFAGRWGDKTASVLDSLAFSLTHLAHFGIVFLNGQWSFLLVPALLWVAFLFFISRLFFRARKESGSILGAIITHAGYNLGMAFGILYLL